MLALLARTETVSPIIAIIVTIMRRGRRVSLLVGSVCTLVFAVSLMPAQAASANVSRSFQSKTALPTGSIVSLDPARSDYVELANTTNSARLTGVVVVRDRSLIAAESGPGGTQVATSGNAPTLVSDLNGDIKVGDQIAASPLNGIGMLANAGSRIIGLAQTDFNNRTEGTTQKVKNKEGKTVDVRVGYITVGVDITNSGGTSGTNINNLQKTVQTITGRIVPTHRIIISIAVITVAVLALISLTYASIYGSIISVGRNPLAKYAVFRTLASVLGLALLIGILAAVSVFFLLR